MNSNSLRVLRGQLLRESLMLLLFSSLMLQSMQAAAPGWWTDRSVLRPGTAADDFAVANVGQLKNLAIKAAQEMNDSLIGGAGPEITSLLATWSNAPASETKRDDYAALNAGQLKAVAKKFYDRLAIVGDSTPGMYPWNGANGDDYALVNVGQLKAVFAFGIAMGSEVLLAMAEVDNDNDGFSDLDEYLSGTDPLNADSMPNGGYVSLSDDSTSDDGPDPEPVFSFYSRTKSEWGNLQGYPALVDVPGSLLRLFKTRTETYTYEGSESQNGSSSSGSSTLSYLENLTYTTTDQFNSSVITGSIMASADESVLGVTRLAQDVNGQGSYSSSSNTSGAPLAYQFYNAEQTASGSFLDDSVKTELHGTEDISDYDNIVHAINNTYDGDNFQKKVSLAYSGSSPVSTEVEETASYQSTTYTYQFRNNGSDGSSSWNNSADVTTRSQITLSGEISLSELGQMVKSSLSAKDWPDEFVKSWGPTPPFATCDIYNYGLSMYATDVEYYVALEWPEGTPESVKQKSQQPREYSWVERYRSVDGMRESTEVRIVSLLPGQQSSHYTASAIGIDQTRSGDVGESVPSLHAYEVLADGSISTTPSGIVASMPSPVIDLSCELKNVRIQADGQLVGDLELSGSITSSTCDTIKGDKGQITQAQLWVNDGESPQATIDVTATKAGNGPRNKPYPYSGSFEQVISAVPLATGNNIFKVTAEDQVYHYPGYNTWVANVKLDGPEDDDELDMSSFTGVAGVTEYFKLTAQLPQAYLDWTQPDDITATIDLNGVVHADVPLTETEDDNGIFAGTLPDGRPVRLTLGPVIALEQDNRNVVLQSELVLGQTENAMTYKASLAESDADPCKFSGGQMVTTFAATGNNAPNGGAGGAGGDGNTPPSDANSPAGDSPTTSPPTLQITSGYAFPLEQSNGGVQHQYVFGMDASVADKCTLKVGEQTLSFIKDNASGLMLLQQPDHPDKPLITQLRDRGEVVDPQTAGFDKAKLNEMYGKTYGEGLRAGLWQGVLDMVDDTGNVFVGAWTYVSRMGAWSMMGEAALIMKATGIGDVDFVVDVMIDIGNEHDAANQQAAEMAKFLKDFVEPLLPNGPTQTEIFIRLLSGDTAGAQQTALNASEVHQMVFNLAAEALKEMKKDYGTGTPGQQGYIEGRVLFEAASFVFGYVKASKLPLLKKVAEKAKFFTRLLATKIPGNFMRKALVAVSGAVELTNLCFVAGTPVRTLEGMLPIEQVRAGMYAWSRDEVSGQMGWKRVMQTFTTHPSVIHHLTYELRGPPEGSPGIVHGRIVSTERIGTTAPHPFFVRNRQQPGFVAAEELRSGDELFISGKRQAVVMSNITEHAPENEAFTTYNFEVADYHTYFAGPSGVWVHNSGSFDCRDLFRAFRVAREKFNGDIWLTFKDMLAKPPAVWDQSWPRRWKLRLFNRVRDRHFRTGGQTGASPPWWSPYLRRAGWKRSADELAHNMNKAFGFDDTPEGFTAHHITPTVYKNGEMRELSQTANDILAKHGIDINDPGNGTYLPNKYAKGFDHENYGPLHTPLDQGDAPNIHSKKYLQQLVKDLEEADVPGASANDIRDALQEFANKLVKFEIKT